MIKHDTAKCIPVVCFLLGNSPASGFHMPTFRNTLFNLHRGIGMKNSYLSAHEDGIEMEQTECSETSAYKIQKKAYNIQNTAKV